MSAAFFLKITTSYILAVWLCSGSSLPFHVPMWKAYRQGEHSSLPFHVPTWRGLRQGERHTPPRTTPGNLPSMSYMEVPVRGASSIITDTSKQGLKTKLFFNRSAPNGTGIFNVFVLAFRHQHIVPEPVRNVK